MNRKTSGNPKSEQDTPASQSGFAISGLALKTAMKMWKTILPRTRWSATEQEQLLNCVTLIALSDLLGQSVEWKQPPSGKGVWLNWKKEGITPTVAGPGKSPSIRERIRDAEVEIAADKVEQLFDQADLEEVERATLFTALPCLGLGALESFLLWTQEPPFPEVGRG